MKRGMRGFWRETVREMKHVSWPSAKEVNRLTAVVFTVCIIGVLYLFGISTGFGTLFESVLRGGR